MKSILSAQVAYRLMKFVLAAGTAALSGSVAYQAINGPEVIRIIGAAVAVVVLVIALDGGFDYLEDLGRAMNGQDDHKPSTQRVQPSQYRIYMVLGCVGVAGSIFLSLLSAGLLSRVIVDDKSGIVEQMEQTKAQGDATYMKILAAADEAVWRAEKALKAAEAKRDAAGRNEVAAIGGEFARLWNSGNAWVRNAPETAANRRRVSKAIAAAQKDVDAANAALASANAAYTQVLTTGKQSADAGMEPILQGQKQVLDNWLKSLSLVKNGFMMTDILAGIGALLLIWLLFKAKALPDEPTLIEQGTRLVRLVGDAFVYAISVGVTAAEKSIEGKINFVAHPLPMPQTLPPVTPPAYNVTPAIVTPTAPVVAGQPTGQNKPVCHKNKAKAKSRVPRTVTKKGRDIVPLSKRTDEQLLTARRKARQRDKDGTLGEAGRRNLSRYEAELVRRGFNLKTSKA